MHRKLHKQGRRSYVSVGTFGDSQSLLEREPLQSKDRCLFSYNIDVCVALLYWTLTGVNVIIYLAYSIYLFLQSFIHCCVHYCGLQMFHVSITFHLLSLSDRIVSSQSNLLDRRTMFVLVSLFLVCLPVFLLLFSAKYHNVLMCFSLCGPHKTTFCFSGCLS